MYYLQKARKSSVPPDFVLGHSLGELNALFAAGAFDFETGLRLVKKRGQLMSRVAGGAMAAVVGLREEELTKVVKSGASRRLSITNYNSPTQFVVGGLREDLDAAAAGFRECGARLVIPLQVSGAFHTPVVLQKRCYMILTN